VKEALVDLCLLCAIILVNDVGDIEWAVESEFEMINERHESKSTRRFVRSKQGNEVTRSSEGKHWLPRWMIHVEEYDYRRRSRDREV